MATPHLEPLTPFETLMWLDDSRRWPLVCYIQITFDGTLDVDALRQASLQAVARHPRLRSRVVTRRGAPHWLVDESAGVDLSVRTGSEDPPPETCNGIDLAKRPGLRLLVRRGEDGGELLMQFHHACCDGVGALAFLGDLLGFYHHRQGEPLPRSLERPPAPWPPAPAADVEASPVPSGGAPSPSPSQVWEQAMSFATFWPAQIAKVRPRRPARHDRDRPDATVPYVTAWSSAPTTQALRRTAGAAGATLNDLLLRDMFLAIDQWNSQRRRRFASRRLRLLMPINMREATQRRLPAMNMMSYGFLQRRPAELALPEKLLEGIAWETRGIRRDRLGNLFLDALALLVRWPRAFGLTLKAPACFATAVVSNLGDPVRRMPCALPQVDGRLRAGNLLVRTIVATPPVRPRTTLALAITSYQGRLGFMAAYCRRTLDHAAAQEFLLSYLDRLEQTAAEPHSHAPARTRAPASLDV